MGCLVYLRRLVPQNRGKSYMSSEASILSWLGNDSAPGGLTAGAYQSNARNPVPSSDLESLYTLDSTDYIISTILYTCGIHSHIPTPTHIHIRKLKREIYF